MYRKVTCTGPAVWLVGSLATSGVEACLLLQVEDWLGCKVQGNDRVTDNQRKQQWDAACLLLQVEVWPGL